MRSLTRLAVVIAAASIPIVGLVAPASAKKVHGHPGAGTPQIIITCSPNPVVETSTSNVAVVCQVEANPTFAGSTVTISSGQLTAHCNGPTPVITGTAGRGIVIETLLNGTPVAPTQGVNTLTVVLDNDGNATVVVNGVNCSPGSALFEASMNAPPFATAVTKLIVQPPQVTPPGLHGFPANEVETGDGGAGQGQFGASDVYAVFYVEVNPVFAEQTVQIGSNELTARCGLGFRWEISSGALATTVTGTNPSPVGATGVVVSNPGLPTAGGIDNDGNAVFIFKGASCAAGKSTVIAEVLNNGPTVSTQYNILPPAVTI
jgi:hypothetical protein